MSIDINDWETEHSMVYDSDERMEIDDPVLIEELEKSNMFVQFDEPEIRLRFDDLFIIDTEEFYPSF